MSEERTAIFFNDREEWRTWLQAHHTIETSVWIRILKGTKTGLSLKQAQEESLCYGWVDVRNKRIDDQYYALKFTPRKAHSKWSISNILLVEELIRTGHMAESGLKTVAEAKHNGQWEAGLKSAQTHVLPEQLEQALGHIPGAHDRYEALKDSQKRLLLHAFYTARSDRGRQRQIDKIIQAVSKE